MKEPCVREWENHTIKPEDNYQQSSRKTRTPHRRDRRRAWRARPCDARIGHCRPQATFGGKDLYPDLFTKAAALLDSLINDHPFVDGNKPNGMDLILSSTMVS